jgi:hypothetical protein
MKEKKEKEGQEADEDNVKKYNILVHVAYHTKLTPEEDLKLKKISMLDPDELEITDSYIAHFSRNTIEEAIDLGVELSGIMEEMENVFIIPTGGYEPDWYLEERGDSFLDSWIKFESDKYEVFVNKDMIAPSYKEFIEMFRRTAKGRTYRGGQ